MYAWWEDDIGNEALEARKRTITFGEPMFCLRGGQNHKISDLMIISD